MKEASNCLSCSDGKFLHDKRCLSEIDCLAVPGFPDANVCVPCFSPLCGSCTKHFSECDSCKAGEFYFVEYEPVQADTMQTIFLRGMDVYKEKFSNDDGKTFFGRK